MSLKKIFNFFKITSKFLNYAHLFFETYQLIEPIYAPYSRFLLINLNLNYYNNVKTFISIIYLYLS